MILEHLLQIVGLYFSKKNKLFGSIDGTFSGLVNLVNSLGQFSFFCF
jgi:hypothetical protein